MQLFTLCYARAGFVRLQTLFCWVLIVVVFGLKTADAAFVGDYALSNFSVTNSVNAIGSAETPDGGLTAVLTGSNTGSGLAGTTDITITSLGAGLLSFDYSYFSNDPDPGFDLAGYLLGSAFTQLADTSGQTGSVQVPLMAGQIFGFRVATVDNIGEPGVL